MREICFLCYGLAVFWDYYVAENIPEFSRVYNKTHLFQPNSISKPLASTEWLKNHYKEALKWLFSPKIQIILKLMQFAFESRVKVSWKCFKALGKNISKLERF